MSSDPQTPGEADERDARPEGEDRREGPPGYDFDEQEAIRERRQGGADAPDAEAQDDDQPEPAA